MVHGEELPQFDVAFRDLGCQTNGNYPAVTLLVVGKRHHARFFSNPVTQQNLRSGTAIDRDVVAPNQFSFYLQSHDCTLGTARSGHYVVISNGSRYTAKGLHEIVSTAASFV